MMTFKEAEKILTNMRNERYDTNETERLALDIAISSMRAFVCVTDDVFEKIKDTAEDYDCHTCKNGHCKNSLQNLRHLHGDCRNHNKFESVRD